MLNPVISTRWLGGYRIKCDVIPPEPPPRKFEPVGMFNRPAPGCVRLRVFAADPYDKAPLGKRGRAYNGPAIAQRVEIPHVDGSPNMAAVREAVIALHRRWPKLWFYDCTGLNLAQLFPDPTVDDWVPAGSDDLSDI